MKCPKCGYTSFESNDSCGKCGNDLTDFREAHGLTPIVLPEKLRTVMAAELAEEDDEEGATSQESSNDMFSFELPKHEEATAQAATNDPFDFSSSPQPAQPPVASDDPFAALLESNQSPAASAQPKPKPAAGGEFNSFSWDDTPVPSAPGAGPQSPKPNNPSDDFSSLFGDLDSPKK